MKKIFYLLILTGALTFAIFAKAGVSMPTPAISATPNSPTSITLNWTPSASTGNITYNLYRNSTSTPIATTSLLAFVDNGLTPLTAYTYYIKAFDNLGDFSNTSSVSTTTLKDETAPSIPLNLSGTAISKSQINLNWSASTDNVAVIGYKIFRDGGQVATSAINSFSDSGLTASTTYNYTVSAFDAANNISGQSSSAAVTTLKTNTKPTTTPVFSIELFNGGRDDKKMVNLRSNQKIRIVLYSDNTYNPDTLDTGTVSLSGAKPVSWTVRRVNRDGLLDFIFDFRSRDIKNILNGSSTIVFSISTKTGQVVTKEFKVRVKNSSFTLAMKNKIEAKISQAKKEMEDRINAAKKKIEAEKNKLEQKINANKNKIKTNNGKRHDD